MVRKKKQPAKVTPKHHKKQKVDEAGPSNKNKPPPSKLPPEVTQEFRRAGHRFMFNVEQIEQKYGHSGSGLVLNVNADQFEFDNELCTADNDEELIRMVQRQNRCLEAPLGNALLSTPASDPDERNQEQIQRWKKLNKVFDATYDQRLKDAEKERTAAMHPAEEGKENYTGNRRRCTAMVPYVEKQAARIHQQQEPPPINVYSLNVERIDFGMLERFQITGGMTFRELSALINSNRHIPIQIPASIKRHLLAIENNDDEDEEEEDGRSKKKRKRTADMPSTSKAGSTSPSSLALVPNSYFIPQTPVHKIQWNLQSQRRANMLRVTFSEEEIVEQTPPDDWRAEKVSSIINSTVKKDDGNLTATTVRARKPVERPFFIGQLNRG